MFRLTRYRRQRTANVLDEENLKALQCGVCTDYMVPPIFVCPNKHSVCSYCKVKMNRCPYCREEITSNKNEELEAMAKNTIYPCIYRTNGCTVKSNVHQAESHKDTCSFRQYLCPLKDSEKCTWNGRKTDLKPHLRLMHCHRTLKFRSATVVAFEVSNPTLTIPGHNYIIFFRSETFFRSFFVKGRDFCCYVQHIGPLSESNIYGYKLSFEGLDGVEYLKTRHRVLCLSEDVNVAIRSGHIFRIPCSYALRFVNNGKLKVQFEMFNI